MSEPALEFRGVTRTFRRTVALDRLDLVVDPGTVLGLVGRNGAGKTTALRLAQGILHPDSGRIRVLGHDPVRRPMAVRRRAALLGEEASLYPWMTVGEITEFAGALHPRWDRAYAADLTGRLDLDPAARIASLSRGTRAKVALLLAAAARPEVLLLDDPTASLDPLARREVLRGILEAVPEEGGAVVYASHLVQDIERLSDRIAVMDAGRIVLDGTLEEVRDRVRRVRGVFRDEPPAVADFPGLVDLERDGRVLTAVVDGEASRARARMQELGAARVEVDPVPLEDVLVACLRGGGREGGGGKEAA